MTYTTFERESISNLAQKRLIIDALRGEIKEALQKEDKELSRYNLKKLIYWINNLTMNHLRKFILNPQQFHKITNSHQESRERIKNYSGNKQEKEFDGAVKRMFEFEPIIILGIAGELKNNLKDLGIGFTYIKGTNE
ncbi:hypothetical protein BKH41_00050 [Helicobacter sp. 12S02232-10]|uniref:hypothetical protein n=1 Tax=Helicobacter sp. 12S02232-10 TaxID=1476197 RepID=UPI000BA6D81D|nr:hypothetical protein [Helicobacter sp. 12S02232-10]PAF49743.1 hypothetical protein BKH41_00050 [Helicobacter sp. 12S02232-10]